MYKSIFIIFAVAALGLAKPSGLGPLAYNSPILGPTNGVVSASTSHVVQQNYNGLNQQLVAAPLPAAYTASALQGAQIALVPQTLSAAPLGYRTTPTIAAAAPLTLQAPTQYAIAAPTLTAASAPLTLAAAPSYVSAQLAPAQFATAQLAPAQFAHGQFAPLQYAPAQYAPAQLAYTASDLGVAPLRYATGLTAAFSGPALPDLW